MRDIETASIVTFVAPHWMSGDRAITGAAMIHQPAPDDAIRRGRDVAISLLLLLLTLPIVLVVACLIKLESPGPMFYRQQRTGLHGRGFTLWKFRSMRTDAEASGACWASQCDPRVTRIGAFIRAHRIDELPQLANVLRGEMSLIGPRPERPIFVEQLVQVMPDFAERTQVLPGVTGWAQVNCPYGASVKDARIKLDHDLFYIRNRSLLLDLRILFRTVGVVLLRTGAR
jgi:lipopolysaccharide/colanic/teichoic acid biosynthesis glycosyltransferase